MDHVPASPPVSSQGRPTGVGQPTPPGHPKEPGHPTTPLVDQGGWSTKGSRLVDQLDLG